MNVRNTRQSTSSTALPQQQIAFDEIFTAIYQGSLEPRPWQSFLRLLRLRLQCEAAMIWLRPPQSGIIPLTLWDRSSPPYNESEGRGISAEAARLAHENVLTRAMEQPGGIFTIDELISREELHKSEFYEKLMKRYDIEHALVVSLEPIPDWNCILCVLNGRSGAFAEPAKLLFAAMKPHLEHALKLYALAKQNEMEKDMYAAALDQLTIGAVTLDGRGRVLDMNKAAKTFLQNNTQLRLAGDTLTFKRNEYAVQLANMIKSAVAWRAWQHKEPFVDAIRVELEDNGAAMGLLVRAMPASQWYQSMTTPAVIMYFYDLSRKTRADARLIARLFGLTHSEARVAARLGNGYSLSEVAKQLQLTENTVRTYSKLIYFKTGVSSQVELIGLIMKSVALLAAEEIPAAS